LGPGEVPAGGDLDVVIARAVSFEVDEIDASLPFLVFGVPEHGIGGDGDAALRRRGTESMVPS